MYRGLQRSSLFFTLSFSYTRKKYTKRKLLVYIVEDCQEKPTELNSLCSALKKTDLKTSIDVKFIYLLPLILTVMLAAIENHVFVLLAARIRVKNIKRKINSVF
jgi:hypothetical protein